MREPLKILIIFFVCLALAAVLMLPLFSGFSSQQVALSGDAFLELVIGGHISEQAADDPVDDLLGFSTSEGLLNLLGAIRKARDDEQIRGILLRPIFAGMGWVKTDEVRQALLDFKKSGKPVYAWMEAASNREYYLASAADSIFGLSTGILYVNGFISSPAFLKGTFDKIGIKADFVAHGRYKNAPDTYTRETISEAQQEVINNLLDQYYQKLRDTLATTRRLSAQKMDALIDRGFMTMEKAYQNNLIDEVTYFSALKDSIKERHEDIRFVGLNRYLQVPDPALSSFGGKSIAVIYGAGTIILGGENQYVQDGLVTSGGMAAAIGKAAANKNIAAIILRIDSPGGSGTASDVIWQAVIEARQKKPVIASFSDVAASGGYYISMAADTIVAHPNSIIGSIGVFAGKYSWKELYDKIGYRQYSFKRGKNADFFSTNQPFTAEQRQVMQDFIMDFYRDFVSKVADGRGMSFEAADHIAQGRVWTGLQGLENGLVDELGYFQDAIRIAKEMADIPEEERVRLETFPKLESYWQSMLRSGFTSIFDHHSLPFDIDIIPGPFRATLQALPHFHAGEPLFLYLDQFIIE